VSNPNPNPRFRNYVTKIILKLPEKHSYSNLPANLTAPECPKQMGRPGRYSPAKAAIAWQGPGNDGR